MSPIFAAIAELVQESEIAHKTALGFARDHFIYTQPLFKTTLRKSCARVSCEGPQKRDVDTTRYLCYQSLVIKLRLERKAAIMKAVILTTFLGSLFATNAAIATAATCQSFTGTIKITNDSLAELSSGGTQYLLEMSSFPYLGQSIAAAGNYMADVKGYSSGQKVTINAALESGVINYGEPVLDISCGQ